MITTSRRQAMTASLGLALSGAALARSAPVRAAEAVTAEQLRTRYKTVSIDGLKLFYREAGSPAAPALLLLHGFPTSSHMFRDLIPALADRYHVIAPDYPGFGLSAMPDRKKFDYTFARYAEL